MFVSTISQNLFCHLLHPIYLRINKTPSASFYILFSLLSPLSLPYQSIIPQQNRWEATLRRGYNI